MRFSCALVLAGMILAMSFSTSAAPRRKHRPNRSTTVTNDTVKGRGRTFSPTGIGETPEAAKEAVRQKAFRLAIKSAIEDADVFVDDEDPEQFITRNLSFATGNLMRSSEPKISKRRDGKYLARAYVVIDTEKMAAAMIRANPRKKIEGRDEAETRQKVTGHICATLLDYRQIWNFS
ncbi:MAG: hypothetical protein PHS41_12775, partial [Victivallaceae bacterium]|nr:hypothetical protein [Victivallaceae bacterium]